MRMMMKIEMDTATTSRAIQEGRVPGVKAVRTPPAGPNPLLGRPGSPITESRSRSWR